MNKPEIVLPDTKINFIRFLYLVLALEDTEKKNIGNWCMNWKGVLYAVGLNLKPTESAGKWLSQLIVLESLASHLEK